VGQLLSGDQWLDPESDIFSLKYPAPPSSRKFFCDLLEAVRLEDDLRLSVAHDIPSKLLCMHRRCWARRAGARHGLK
jgi:hypothetical protein